MELGKSFQVDWLPWQLVLNSQNWFLLSQTLTGSSSAGLQTGVFPCPTRRFCQRPSVYKAGAYYFGFSSGPNQIGLNPGPMDQSKTGQFQCRATVSDDIRAKPPSLKNSFFKRLNIRYNLIPGQRPSLPLQIQTSQAMPTVIFEASNLM